MHPLEGEEGSIKSDNNNGMKSKREGEEEKRKW